MAKKKHNQNDVQFNEHGMRNFENLDDAVAYFSNPEHGGHAIRKINLLFNSTFIIRVGIASINLCGWKSKSFSKSIESVFKTKEHRENFDVIFAKWKSKFEDEKPQIVDEPKHDEPIVDENENTIVD